MGVRNVCTLLWRTLNLQAVRRHYLATALEIFIVPLVFVLVIDTMTETAGNKLGTTPKLLRPRTEALPVHLTGVVYGPDTHYTRQLMQSVVKIVKERTPRETRNSSEATPQPGTGAEPDSKELTKLKIHEATKSAAAVWEACRGIMSKAIEEDNSEVQPLCVSFAGDAVDQGGPNLAFEVIQYTGLYANMPQSFPLEPSQTAKLDHTWDAAWAYQSVIEEAHLTLQREASHIAGPLPDVTLEVLPEWISAFNTRIGYRPYKGDLYVAICFGFMITLVKRVSKITQEFSSGLAEHQGVMGLKDRDFFIGHLITTMVIGIVQGTLVVLVMYIAQVGIPLPSEGDGSSQTLVKHDFESVPYMHDVDPTLAWTAMLMFLLSLSLLAMFITRVFPKGKVSLFVGMMVLIAPVLFSSTYVGSLLQYFLQKRALKLALAVFPQIAFYESWRIICIAQELEGKAGWDLITRHVLHKDNITITEIWIVMLVGDVAMVLLGWYLSKVLPWATTNRQPPYFFLLPTYWVPCNVVAVETAVSPEEADRFEQMPADAKPLVVTQDLRKVYGNTMALDGVSLKVYESKCTVLLGHNGAGKTTLMSILTGINGPTSGSAYVCGRNVSTHREIVRRSVSFCPQFDIFFDDLTVLENLVYFASLKGIKRSELHQNVKDTLSKTNLEEKAHTQPKNLSGGMKRRLSMGIALASKPKLVILDEPTAGMDPEARRHVWDVLQHIVGDTSILISTHDMEEADALGDSIIIMAYGKVICSGSIAFLKKACRVGYKLNVETMRDPFNMEYLMAVVKSAAQEAEVEEVRQKEVTIKLNTLDTKNFAQMFQTLETSAGELGIGSVGVTVASMKDAYIKINLDWVPGTTSAEEPVNDAAIESASSAVKRQPSARGRVRALFAKRLTQLARNWMLLVGLALVTLVVLLLWLIGIGDAMPKEVHHYKQSQWERNESFVIDLWLPSLYPAKSTVLLQEVASSPASNHFHVLVEADGAVVKSVQDLDTEARQMANSDFAHYVTTVPLGAAYEADRVRAVFNPVSLVSRYLLLNLVNQAQLRVDSGKVDARLNSSVRFAALPPQKDVDWAKLIAVLQDLIAWLEWTVLVSFSLSVILCTFVAFPTGERLSRVRDMQLMSGISGAFYVLGHLMVDFAIYLVAVAAWFGFLLAFKRYSVSTFAAIGAILFCFGPLMILMDYVVAEQASSVTSGLVFLLMLLSVGTFVSILAYVMARSYVGDEVRYGFILFPPFGLIASIVQAVQTGHRAVRCGLHDASKEVGATTEAWRNVSDGGFTTKIVTLTECTEMTRTQFDFSYYGSLFDMSTFLAEALVLYVILTMRHSACRWRPRSWRRYKPADQGLDADVAEQKRVVEELRGRGDFSAHTLVAWNVHKYYGYVHAVRGFNVALRPSECFGLLGVNGAGKTSTFEMLAGFSYLSDGEAYAGDLRVTRSPRKWQSEVGYCFQQGGLLACMNTYEFLYLMGRLRGISDADLKTLVESLIVIVDLKPHAKKQCGLYSGGNKRKLSIAAALLGMPPLVFLDEPYAGVDVVSRTKIFKYIHAIKQRSSSTIVMTSHNMEECEFSCDRLTIMVAGQMRCLGSLQHLKEKFGKGYRFEFMLKHGAGQDPVKFVNAVLELFPGMRVAERHENVCVFLLEEKMAWSTTFARVDRLEAEFELEHAFVGENTLEQIFIAFAKQGETKEAASDTNNANEKIVEYTPTQGSASTKTNSWAPEKKSSEEQTSSFQTTKYDNTRKTTPDLATYSALKDVTPRSVPSDTRRLSLSNIKFLPKRTPDQASLSPVSRAVSPKYTSSDPTSLCHTATDEISKKTPDHARISDISK